MIAWMLSLLVWSLAVTAFLDKLGYNEKDRIVIVTTLMLIVSYLRWE